MILLFVKLLLAHLLGDFVLQPDTWVLSKVKLKEKSPYLYFHVLVHGFLLALFLFDVNSFLPILIILVSHYFIDLAKLRLHGKLSQRKLFFMDQFCHLIVLAIVAVWLSREQIIFTDSQITTLIYLATAFVSLTIVSARVVRTIMTNWKVAEDTLGESLPNAGMYIGILERLFVFCFIVLNQWSALGFLIAAKSIFRFSDLSRAKDRKLTEYVIIGTLLSFGMAVLIGLAYQVLLSTI
jgi:hypothetical protein